MKKLYRNMLRCGVFACLAAGASVGVVSAAENEVTYSKAILGSEERDKTYVAAGVLKDGVYSFTADKTTITLDGEKDPDEQDRALILGDNWVARNIYAVISGAIPQKNEDGSSFSSKERTNVKIDMNGHALTVNANYDGGGGAAIAAVGNGGEVNCGGSVEISNAGPIDINIKTGGLSTGLFANLGGKLTIHNGGENAEDKVLTIRASSTTKGSAAVIKTMNGNRNATTKDGLESEITIDGLVDVLADGKADEHGYAANEAVSAVASTINIGGGTIKAVNGAWAAIRAYGEFVSANYGIVNINAVNKVMGPDKANSTAYVVQSFDIGDYRTQITGDFVTNGGMGTKGQINVGLNGADSFWEGNYADTNGYGVTQGTFGAVNLKLKDGAHWKGFANGSVNLEMTGKDTYWLGFNIREQETSSYATYMTLSLNDGATWYNAITPEQTDQTGKNLVNAKVHSLSGSGGVIDMTGTNVFVASSKSLTGSSSSAANSKITESTNGVTGDVDILNYSGDHTVIYRHDDSDPTTIIGGTITITSAAEDSSVSLFTDRNGIDTSDKDTVTNVLSSLAKKIIYTEAIATDNDPNPTINLAGHVGLSEGLTAQSAAVRIADIGFDSKTGEGVLNAGSIHTPDSYIPILYGSTETAMMKGAKSAMAASALLWRAENNDLMKRMGDLRLSPGDTGVWAKYYSGRYQMDAQNTDLSLKYKAYQVGFDKKAGNWIVGAAFSYNDGSASYGTGSADLEAKSIGLYGTWKGKSGQYLDVIAKYSRLDDEYDVYNTSGHKLNGDYKTSGVSLSVEYGRRLERENGFYTEPSVELTFGHIGSKDYSAQSDYLTSVGTKKDMEVHQGGFTTLVGRLGVRVGQKRAHSSYFGKVALAHEFDGGFDSTFRAAGEPEGKTSLDFGGTWLELAVGGTLQLKDSTALYGSVERSFGSDVEEKWRIDAGFRFSF